MRRLTCTCGHCPTCWCREGHKRRKARKEGRPYRNPFHYGGAAIRMSEARFEVWASKQRAVWDEESRKVREWIDRVKREAARALPAQSV